MDDSLARKLLAKNLINDTTEVLIKYKGSSISGDANVKGRDCFSIDQVLGEMEDGSYGFVVSSTRDGHRRTITHKDILEIDGMTPIRFASVYDIRPDGSAAILGKRRGRKPKDRSLTQTITPLIGKE